MHKAILVTITRAAIVIGIVAIPFALYEGFNSAVYDGSVPHDSLWQQLFGH